MYSFLRIMVKTIHSASPQVIIHKLSSNRSEEHKEKDNVILDLQQFVLYRSASADFSRLHYLTPIGNKTDISTKNEFQSPFIFPHVFQNSYDSFFCGK